MISVTSYNLAVTIANSITESLPTVIYKLYTGADLTIDTKTGLPHREIKKTDFANVTKAWEHV
jgi:hypothetical protein